MPDKYLNSVVDMWFFRLMRDLVLQVVSKRARSTVGERLFPGCGRGIILVCVVTVFLSGSYLFASEPAAQPTLLRYRVFSVNHIPAERGKQYLDEVGVGTVSQLPGANALLVTAEPLGLLKATAILELVDSTEDFAVNQICPASQAAGLPPNDIIAAKVGRISIGTFSDPPVNTAGPKAIVDTHKQAVIAIAPVEWMEKILAAIDELRKSQTQAQRPAEPSELLELAQAQPQPEVIAQPEPETVSDSTEAEVNELEEDELFGRLLRSLAETEKKAAAKPGKVETEPKVPPAAAEKIEQAVKEDEEKQLPSDLAVAVEEPQPEREREPQAQPEAMEAEEEVEPEPEVWSYEPEPIAFGDEMLELDLPDKLNIIDLLGLVGEYLNLDYMYDPAEVKGDVTLRLRGPIKVKELYPLLESVLKFKGFVMSRKGNLVTIVPAAKAMEIDPFLQTPERGLRVGDVIITRLFELQYIDTASAQNLLSGMKLGTDITPIPETGTLIVTEYAHRMGRVEEILEMIDRPGEPKQFRFRQLKYTMAKTLAPQIKTLVEQLGGISVTVAPPQPTKPARPTPTSRTRRPTTPSRPTPAQPAKPSVYLDADERTNRILMIGFDSELNVVDQLIDTLDVAQQDLRTLRLYEIQHVGAEEVMNKLQELGMISSGARTTTRTAPGRTSRTSQPTSPGPETGPTVVTEEGVVEEPQVIVIESTNSLLVNATAEQHAQIAVIISYVDSVTLERAIPYEIYSLENQDPEIMAEVLNKLIQETIKDKEGKIERVIKKEEDIVIVPDPSTFSIIVYASKKNQEWVKKLISSLDKRRPQVLIDVTLVEIRREEDFEYDLDLVTKIPKLARGGEMDTLTSLLSPFPVKTVLEATSSAGTGQGFYADRHIQALLRVMQEKGYGRVLAKPKILVNDNETGTITTVDKRYIPETSRIFPDTGPVQESTKFNAFDAKIELKITPHISEGDLLRLEVGLTREDFLEASSAEGAPPNQATSNVETIVTVPDQKTIILGGLIKLNQNKAGGKVPLLGDIPLVGGLFRNVDNSQTESKLYVFVKANILRPSDKVEGLPELEQISDRNKVAFERSESEFQRHQDFPGFDAEPMDPLRVLEEE